MYKTSILAPEVTISLSDPTAAEELVGRIIEQARGRGMDQSDLARRAGISPEALSRLKKSGGCRLSTALGLARAAGLTCLSLEERTPKVAASISARKLSAGRRTAITPEELIAYLTGRRLSKDARPHLIGLFEEVPIELVHDLILDEGLDYADLLSLARALGAEGETVDWLAEMAGDSLAYAA